MKMIPSPEPGDTVVVEATRHHPRFEDELPSKEVVTRYSPEIERWTIDTPYGVILATWNGDLQAWVEQ